MKFIRCSFAVATWGLQKHLLFWTEVYGLPAGEHKCVLSSVATGDTGQRHTADEIVRHCESSSHNGMCAST